MRVRQHRRRGRAATRRRLFAQHTRQGRLHAAAHGRRVRRHSMSRAFARLWQGQPDGAQHEQQLGADARGRLARPLHMRECKQMSNTRMKKVTNYDRYLHVCQRTRRCSTTACPTSRARPTIKRL